MPLMPTKKQQRFGSASIAWLLDYDSKSTAKELCRRSLALAVRVFRTHSLGCTSSTNFDSGFLQRGASYSALRKKYKPLLEP